MENNDISEQIIGAAIEVQSLDPIHDAQLLTYLKVGGWKVGLLINFNVPLLKNGIHRMVN